MSILDYHRMKDLPPLSDGDEKELKTRRVKGTEYLRHPVLGCYWDHNHNEWVRYPRETAIDATGATYIQYESPELDRAIQSYLAGVSVRDSVCLEEQLALIVSVIFTHSSRKDLDDTHTIRDERFAIGLAQADLLKLSSHGVRFVKHLKDWGLLSSEWVRYRDDGKYNTFYSFTGKIHVTRIDAAPFRFRKTSDNYERFTRMLYGERPPPAEPSTYPIELLQTADFSFKVDHLPLDHFKALERDRLIKKYGDGDADWTTMINALADDNSYRAIGKAKDWNRMSYAERCEKAYTDGYGGRMYSPFTDLYKWTRQFACHDGGKVLLAIVDMQSAVFQIMSVEMGVTSGPFYEDVFHDDYYTAMASRLVAKKGKRLARKPAKDRSMQQTFGTLKSPFTKQFVKLYPGIKTRFLEMKEKPCKRLDGTLPKDNLNLVLHKAEVCGMRGVIERLTDQQGASCIKVHDELMIFIDPLRHAAYTPKQIQRYYLKVIVGAFRESFGFRETQLHIQFAGCPERDVACWNLGGRDTIVVMDGDRRPVEAYPLDDRHKGQWRSELLAYQAAERRYGRTWRRALWFVSYEKQKSGRAAETTHRPPAASVFRRLRWPAAIVISYCSRSRISDDQ